MRSGRWAGGPPGGERGSASIEAVIVLGMVIVTFFSLMIAAGRVMSQQNKVRTAAQAAARAASLQDNHDEAFAAAEEAAAVNLADGGVVCQNQAVRVERADLVPGGFITIEVSCTASLLPLFGVSRNDFSYRATEAIDEYRGTP